MILSGTVSPRSICPRGHMVRTTRLGDIAKSLYNNNVK